MVNALMTSFSGPWRHISNTPMRNNPSGPGIRLANNLLLLLGPKATKINKIVNAPTKIKFHISGILPI